MVCKIYFNTDTKFYKHFERFHDELRQFDRGIERGGMKDSDDHIRKRNKVIGNEVEMYGEGYRQNEMESESEISDDDNNGENKCKCKYCEEGRWSNDIQSEGSVDISDTQSEMTDVEDNDRDDMKGFGDIKFVGDEIYEWTDSDLDLDNEDIEIDRGGYVFTCGR